MVNQIINSPKVFISYSHDSPEHQDRILKLSDRLRYEGVDCKIDQYYSQTQLPEGWHHWMMNRIDEANFVLMVCTENYYLRYRGKVKDDVGRGVKWEGAIITQDLYMAGTLNHKCIPVLFTESGKLKYIPEPLRSSSHYWLDRQYEDLYRHLTKQQSTPMPKLGNRRQLRPRELKQDFFNGTQNSKPKSFASSSEIPVPDFEPSEVGVDYTKLQDLPKAKKSPKFLYFVGVVVTTIAVIVGNSLYPYPYVVSPSHQPSNELGSVRYLSDMPNKLILSYQQEGKLQFNKSFNGGKMKLNFKSYPKGLGTHALSRLIFQLDKKWDYFETEYGMDDEEGDNDVNSGMKQSSAIFMVYLDSKLFHKSPVMTRHSPTGKVRLPVKNVENLELMTTDAEDGNNGDHTDWADAKLIKE